jgi:hypothetical protein
MADQAQSHTRILPRQRRRGLACVERTRELNGGSAQGIGLSRGSFVLSRLSRRHDHRQAIGSAHHPLSLYMPYTGVCRRRKQATPEVQHYRSSTQVAIIEVPALLRLADWIRSRRDQGYHGGSPCDTPKPAQSPPAHAEAKSANSPDKSLESAAQIRSRSHASDTEPHCRSANPKTARRQGGRS